MGSKMMKYCVIGNIVKEHVDNAGILRYGTRSFPGGRKVYISRRLWGDVGEVTVMGLNRYKNRYSFERVPLNLIDNIRSTRTFEQGVVKLMQNDTEYEDMWFLYKEEDKVKAEEYVRILNLVKLGDKTAFNQYYRDYMYRFY